MKKRLLIANRGEIAIRVAKTAHEYGYFCIGLAREKDSNELYLSSMDDVAYFEKETVQDTFLSEKAIINLAKNFSADMLHPGYGFLSESATFAKILTSAGIRFLGPSPETLDLLGNKIRAKELAEQLSVPVVPGFRGDLSGFDTRAKKKIGYPMLVKAGAGGGGRGMRIVSAPEELKQALAASREEALRAFGDGTLFIEKYVEPARHIEVQVCGDTHGTVIHLYERDCSLQRRFQKIIEAAPAEGIPESVLQHMREAAIQLARAAGLTSLATIEFLYDPEGEKFYFMECNPRLQVEHTVTEEVTGIDLVGLQIEVAEGKRLPPQGSISAKGAAIQARICAEVPEEDSRPVHGTITSAEFPDSVRVDSGVSVCSNVSNDFDSLLCKIIVSDESMHAAKLKLVKALKTMKLTGIPVSIGYLIRVLESFSSFSECSTSCLASFQKRYNPEVHQESLISLASFFYSYVYSGIVMPTMDPFSKGIRPREFQFLPVLEVTLHQFELKKRVQIPAYIPFSKEYAIMKQGESMFKTYSEGKESLVQLLNIPEEPWQDVEALFDGYHISIAPARPEKNDRSASAYENEISAPLPGTVLSVFVTEGDTVSRGDKIISFDSMKTEHVLSAPVTGIVERVEVSPGNIIERGQILVHIEPKKDTQTTCT
jgi:acetyl/propionyl-CoA carboxylase alpha subunit